MQSELAAGMNDLTLQYIISYHIIYLAAPGISVGVTESREQDLDTNFTGLWRSYLYVFDHQRLIGFPGHRGFQISKQKKKKNHNHNQHRIFYIPNNYQNDRGKQEKRREIVPLHVIT